MPELAEVLHVSLLRRVDSLARADTHLDRLVTVLLQRLHLDYCERSGLDHRHGYGLAVALENLGHAQLAPQDAFNAHSLISMSTPDGSCSRIRASTVLEVGSRMSISRLCVRISNCSRESLSMWGERITVKRSMAVGSGTGPATAAPVRSAASTISTADWSSMRWSKALRRIRIF